MKLEQQHKSSSGLVVDSSGNQAIDPTLNVKELVKLHKEWADDIRNSDAKFRDFQIAMIDARTKREVDHLKEISDFHVEYGKELDKERAISTDAKAKVLESQLTIDRERATLSAQLLAKTVTDNAEKLRGELDGYKKENNDRFLRIEGSASTSTGKSAGVASAGDWGIRIVLLIATIISIIYGISKS